MGIMVSSPHLCVLETHEWLENLRIFPAITQYQIIQMHVYILTKHFAGAYCYCAFETAHVCAFLQDERQKLEFIRHHSSGQVSATLHETSW